MKKFLLLILVAMTAFGVNAQTRKGEGSLMEALVTRLITRDSVYKHRDAM